MENKNVVFFLATLFSLSNLISYTYKIVNMTGEPLKMGKVEWEDKTRSSRRGNTINYKSPKKGSDFGNRITLIYRGLCRFDNIELEIGQTKEINSKGCCLKDIALGGGTLDNSSYYYSDEIFPDFPAKQYLLKDKFMCKDGTFKIHKKHDGTYYLGKDEVTTAEAATKEATQMEEQAKSGKIDLRFIPVKHISVEVQNSLLDQNKTAIAKSADKSGLLHNYVKSFPSFKTISPLQLETAEDMVTAGLLDQKDINGETPLFIAVKNGSRDWVLFLVRHKADIFSKNNNGENLLYWAIKNGDLYIIQLLLKAAQMLLQESKLDKKIIGLALTEFLNIKDKEDKNLLHVAVQKGDLNLIKILIKAKQDTLKGQVLNGNINGLEYASSLYNFLNEKDNNGNTPLDMAVNIQDARKIYEFFLDPNFITPRIKIEFNVNKIDPRDGKSLFHRVAQGSTDMAKLFLQNGADINSVSQNGSTALHLAVKNGDEGMVKLLLENKADVNKQGSGGKTPLHEALVLKDANKRRKILKLLLAYKADVNIKNNLGLDVMRMAKGLGYEKDLFEAI